MQGSRPQPYQVSIALQPFPAALWSRIEDELAGQAFFSARLLAGDLPDELEELFAAAGAPLFPAAVDELTQRCNCPDFAVPCKHLAATFYLLAEAFDADPFELLHWRGRSRAELLDELRARRAAGHRCRPTAPTGRPTVRTGRCGSRQWTPWRRSVRPGRSPGCRRRRWRRRRTGSGRAGAAARSAAPTGDRHRPAAAPARSAGPGHRWAGTARTVAPRVPGVRSGRQVSCHVHRLSRPVER